MAHAMWHDYINKIRRAILANGRAAHFRLKGDAMRDQFPFHPNWRDEADTQERLFANYCAAMGVVAIYDAIDDKFDLSIASLSGGENGVAPCTNKPTEGEAYLGVTH